MTVSDDLFKLIKSLTKTERRYFTISTSTYGRETSYTKLFNLIDAQTVYDEQAIKRQMKVSQFPVLKTRLFQLILNSIGGINGDKNIDAAIREYLIQARVLQEKNLMEPAIRLYEKARIRAIRSGRYELALEAIRLYPRRGLKENDIDLMWMMEEELLHNISRVTLLRRLLSQLENRFYEKGFVRCQRDFEEYAAFIHHDVIRNFSLNSDIESKYYYHILNAWFYFAVMAYERVHDHILQLLVMIHEEDLDNSDSLWRERKGDILILYLRCCTFSKRFIEAEFVSNAIEEHKYLSFQYDELYTVQLEALVQSGQVTENNNLLEFAEQYINDYAGDERFNFNYYSLQLQLSRYYLVSSSCKKSIKYANALMNSKNGSKCFLSFHAIQISILMHLCLGNVELVESSLRGYQRRLQMSNRMFKYESLFIAMIKRLIHLKDEDRTKVFEHYKQEFNVILEDQYEKNAFLDFDILAWIDAQLENCNMSVILLRKHENSISI